MALQTITRVVTLNPYHAVMVGCRGTYIIIRKTRGCALWFMDPRIDGVPHMSKVRDFTSVRFAKTWVKEYAGVTG